MSMTFEHEVLTSPEIQSKNTLETLKQSGLPIIARSTTGQWAGGITTGEVDSDVVRGKLHYEYNIGNQIGLYDPTEPHDIWIGKTDIYEGVRRTLELPPVADETMADVAQAVQLLGALDNAWQSLRFIYDKPGEYKEVLSRAYQMFATLVVREHITQPSLLPKRIVCAFSVLEETNKQIAAERLNRLMMEQLKTQQHSLSETHARKLQQRYLTFEQIAHSGRRPLSSARRAVARQFQMLVAQD